MRRPFLVSGRELVTTASVGINLTDRRASLDAALADADAAMYRAKHDGKDRAALFDDALAGAAAARLELEADLRAAVDRDELFMVFQPEIGLATSRAVALEALLRWTNARRGPVPPSEFIPIAEQSGVIDRIGSWVLGQGAAHLSEWHEIFGGDAPTLAVNVSGRQFVRDDFVDEIAKLLANHTFPPHLLCLEITETILMKDPASSARQAVALRKLGVRLALDDFGTGCSSFAYLRRYPIDFVKIDKTFVRLPGQGQSDRTFGAAPLTADDSGPSPAAHEGHVGTASHDGARNSGEGR